MRVVFVLIIFCLAEDIPVDLACSWNSNEPIGKQCAPHSLILCEFWRRLYSRNVNVIDDYTAAYFNNRLCLDVCLDKFDYSGCRSQQIRRGYFCHWHGLNSTSEGGSCRGDVILFDKIDLKQGSVNKAARLSYGVGLRDCEDICGSSGLGRVTKMCPLLRDCCVTGLADNSTKSEFTDCTFDSRIIARKYAPVMKALAAYEMTCRSMSTRDKCLEISSNSVSLPMP